MTYHKLLLALVSGILLLATLPAAHAAVSLGSVQDRYSAEIFQGEETGFSIFLFNIHDQSTLNVNLEAEYPFGLYVVVTPTSMSLPYLPTGTPLQEGYGVLSTPEGNVMVKTASVRVFSANNTAPGEYDIRVNAVTQAAEGTLAISQERGFRFRVSVKENAAPEEEEELLEEGVASQEQPAEPIRPEEGQPPESGEGQGQSQGANTFTRQVEEAADAVSRVTGSIINNPAISPVILLVVILAGIYLKKSDRI